MTSLKTWTALVFLVPFAALAEAPEKPEFGLAKIGEGLFHGYCTSCHGEQARGDGPVAEYLVVSPTDLTKLCGEDGEFPFDEVLEKIDGRESPRAHGSPDMPVWGDALGKAEGGGDDDVVKHKLAALTHYLWSVQAELEADSGPTGMTIAK